MEVDGEMQAIPITESPLVKDMLDPTFTYILDCETEIFIWVGKKSDWESKASGIMLADVRPLLAPSIVVWDEDSDAVMDVRAGLPDDVRETLLDADDPNAGGHRDRPL